MCFLHGGGAPQVKAKAQQRIAAMLNPALRCIAACLEPRQFRDNPTLALRAAEDALELNDLWPGKGTKKAGAGLTMPSLDSLPPGSTVTATASIKVETLTDDELEILKRLLEKMGAGHALQTIDAETVPQP